jgi:hypothetical protein
MRFTKWLAAALVLAVCGLVACSTLRTTTDFDPRADFSRYRTFDVSSITSSGDDLLGRRIQAALETEFASKGLTESRQSPDLLVVAHARVGHQTEIVTWGSGWGWGRRWGGGPGLSYSTVEKIAVGTLVVDLVDAKNHELVWRSTASDAVDPDATPARREKSLTAAVSKMFETYPRA